MRLLFGSFFTFLLAAAIGLGATWFTLTRGIAFGSLTIGAWTAWPKTGSQDIDPYAHASIARDGELPIGIGDGVAFFARADDKGQELDGRCTFALIGMTPAGTLLDRHALQSARRLVANALDRHGFTSQEIIRDVDGHFTIAVAPQARPGNWLPTGGIERFVLVWRLYDTPIGVATATMKEGPMPAVERKGCS